MKRNAIVISLLVLLALWGLYDYNQRQSEQERAIARQQEAIEAEVGIQRGNLAPDFQLLNMEGQPVQLSDFRGKKVIVNFWATWCPPCRAEMPHMEKFYNDFSKEAVVLAVNLTNTEKNQSDVTAFIDDLGLTFPILLDEKGEVAGMYQVFAYPTSYMIDSQGIIREIFQGAINYDVMKKTISAMDE